LSRDHLRVVAARRRLERHFSAKHSPGTFRPGRHPPSRRRPANS
jgi:hypothetical protein